MKASPGSDLLRCGLSCRLCGCCLSSCCSGMFCAFLRLCARFFGLLCCLRSSGALGSVSRRSAPAVSRANSARPDPSRQRSNFLRMLCGSLRALSLDPIPTNTRPADPLRLSVGLGCSDLIRDNTGDDTGNDESAANGRESKREGKVDGSNFLGELYLKTICF